MPLKFKNGFSLEILLISPDSIAFHDRSFYGMAFKLYMKMHVTAFKTRLKIPDASLLFWNGSAAVCLLLAAAKDAEFSSKQPILPQ